MQMPEPLVSIICTAYNHGPFIRQCLDGFMMQKTNFPFEVLIHDDASTDNTAEIIREYEDKYPDIIKPIYQTENQYQKGIKIGVTYLYPRAKGKYIAECEGDDYWTDPLKLQKQVDFLEVNLDYSMCSHSYLEYYQENNLLSKEWPHHKDIHYDINTLLNGFWLYHPMTVVFRSSCLDLEHFTKYPKSMDAVLFYHLLRASKGIHLKDCMAVYRIHDHGVWSRIGLNKQREMEFKARLGVCHIDHDVLSAKFLKMQFFKPMSRLWMIKNISVIMQSLRIIYKYIGLWSAFKSIVNAMRISVP